jgi:dephospho-CoA kinase
MKKPPLRLGVTGGIGSGKSSVAQILTSMGAACIDADAISRATTASGGQAIPAIEKTFGSAMLNAQGALERESMRALVFKDPSARAKLEAIVHPLVAAQIATETALALAREAPCLVFDIPLLVESPRWRKVLDRVLVVDCSPQTQIQRVMQRSGLSELEVSNIMRAQSSRLTRLQAADLVVFNDGTDFVTITQTLEELRPFFGL